MKKGVKIAAGITAAVFGSAVIAFGVYWYHNMHWFDKYEKT